MPIRFRSPSKTIEDLTISSFPTKGTMLEVRRSRNLVVGIGPRGALYLSGSRIDPANRNTSHRWNYTAQHYHQSEILDLFRFLIELGLIKQEDYDVHVERLTKFGHELYMREVCEQFNAIGNNASILMSLRELRESDLEEMLTSDDERKRVLARTFVNLQKVFQ